MATRRKTTKKPTTSEDDVKSPEEAKATISDLEASFAKEKENLEKKIASAKDENAKLLERVSDEREAQADKASGIEIGLDLAFLQADPSDITPYLERGKQDYEPEKYHYRWVSTNPRQYNKRRTQGYEPVPGGIQKGDQVACRIPKEMHAKRLAMLEAKKRLFNEGESDKLVNEIRKAGGEAFDGSGSRKEGLR